MGCVRVPTWKILRWDGEPDGKGEPVSLECPHCGHEALMPRSDWDGATIIAAFGLSVILDPPIKPPDNWMPGQVRCRKCRHGFEKMSYAKGNGGLVKA